MKRRDGFVSNSSSSSFVIKKSRLHDWQVEAIHDHIRYAREHFYVAMEGCIDEEWAWHISEDDAVVSGSTWMNNFDMQEFLSLLDVEDDDITWGR